MESHLVIFYDKRCHILKDKLNMGGTLKHVHVMLNTKYIQELHLKRPNVSFRTKT